MKKVLYILLLSLLAVSCKMTRQFQDAASELFRGQVVARVGNHKLYRSELLKYIPAGASPEDSASLALQWINAWAEDILLLDMAEEQLSGEDKDVRKELEEYRRTLLKYRYEQLYINQRLDTLITDEEIEQYYLANKERFRLDRPLMKARYMIISAGARSLPVLKEKMSSDNEQEIMMADSLGSYAAIKYVDAADTWMDAITLASEMGLSQPSRLSVSRSRRTIRKAKRQSCTAASGSLRRRKRTVTAVRFSTSALAFTRLSLLFWALSSFVIRTNACAVTRQPVTRTRLTTS